MNQALYAHMNNKRKRKKKEKRVRIRKLLLHNSTI
jgi:ribosomal protein S21